MYDPDVLDKIGDSITGIYERAELYLIRVIRDALLRTGDEPEWAMDQLLAIRQERRRIQSLRAVLDRQVTEAWPEVVDAAYLAGVAQAERELGEIERAGFFESAPGTTPVNDAAVTALAMEGIVATRQVNAGILRRTEDAWRRIVSEATGYTTTGAMTIQQATQRAFTRMAREGMGFYVDSRGRKWGLDTYASMAVRTATTRALLAGHTDTMIDRGIDLVVVSSHPRPAPVCAPYERQVLSLTGKHAPGTHRIGDSIVRVKATMAQAERAGLHHVNCKHRHSAYVPGYTDLTPPEPDPGNAGYKATQKQRYLEREIRASKRMEEAALTEPAKLEARQRTRAYQAKLRDHIAEHDLPRKRNRERVAKPGGLVSADLTPVRNAEVIAITER
ncbi:phage minor capsid protein [Corynebacterium timonense]|uniref:Phage minor capsid protein 2 n=1 Tax=Corynebacterium timonense TaxID=441500 RepID=A0A1H1LQ63_9CORY|nr:phage minor capsid protein [Corynebacterium timonense]SDR76691.1 Phage minor capsid protein 2 [Corynebacterium timonense]